MRNYFLPALSLAVLLGSVLGSCSPKLVPLTSDNESAALPAGTPYAVVHFYRPGKLAGFLIGYDVHLDDSVVYRASNGSHRAVRCRPAGAATVWAKTEAREEISLALRPGREYYVRCTLGAGVLVGRPHLRQLAAEQGRKESASIPVR